VGQGVCGLKKGGTRGPKNQRTAGIPVKKHTGVNKVCKKYFSPSEDSQNYDMINRR
jgi:hypothetical protein